MSEYQVLARKYRPQIFHDVVGQQAIVSTLKNAILHKRSAHAYLFCGSRGTGKTTLARLFAKALNCKASSSEAEPCNQCPSCREITSASSMDVVEIDGASHRGIEDIRQINETIGFAPVGKLYKIYLIDEVHMLTKEAFNALLKTLEEPPSHVKFFFCTTEPHKIPATILSRCQRFNLRRIPLNLLTQKLEKILIDHAISSEPAALELIAQKAEGALRDALSLLDQVIAFDKAKVSVQSVTEALGLPSRELFFSLAHAGERKEWQTAFKIAEELFTSGRNLPYFLEELTEHFRTLLLLKNELKVGGAYTAAYQEIIGLYRLDQLIQIVESLLEAQGLIKSAPSERTFIEMVLLQILRSHHQISIDVLVERLVGLEQKVLSGQTMPPPSPRAVEMRVTPPPQEHPTATLNQEPERIQTIQQKVEPSSQPISIEEQSRFDTIMRFAAKELNGSLKKE